MTPTLRAFATERLLAVLGVASLLVSLASMPLLSADLRLDYKPAAYAIKGATIVTGSGDPINPGTVIVRNGVIEAVGPADSLAIPYDAETIDGKGLHVYPGFIDLFTTIGQPAGVTKSRTGEGRTLPYADYAYPRTPLDHRYGITPEYDVASSLDLPDSIAEERRKLGFTDVVAAPSGAIAAGQSALASLSGLPRRENVIKSQLALQIALRNPGGMGFFESQACSDDDHGDALNEWLRAATFTAAQDPGTPAPATPARPSPPETTPAAPAVPGPTPATPAPNTPDQPGRRRAGGGQALYPTSLMGVVAHLRQAMLDAEHHQELKAFYDEKGGARPAFDPALDALHAARTKALPVWWEANTRDEIHRALDLAEEFGTTAVIVGGREAWKVTDRLKALDVPVVIKLDFPEEPKVPTKTDYNKKKAEDREATLAVLADRKARWDERVANAAVLSRAGVRFAFASDGLTRLETFPTQIRATIKAGLSADAALAALTRDAAGIVGQSKRLGTIEPGKLGHLVAMSAPFSDEKAKPRYALIDGNKFDLDKATPSRKGGGRAGASKGEEKAEPKKDADSKTEARSKDEKIADTSVIDPPAEFDANRKPTIKTGGNAFIKGATILTVSRGRIDKGNIQITDGKIHAVGPDIEPVAGSTIIEGAGLVAMPGIIDTHSHLAIQGGVNEMSLSIVPEVRVKDVITGDDPGIYRALAGGTTTARLLHGSANTIGGQDAVIKFKHGLAGRDLLIKDGPQGVKFALGENVTRRSGRFPNTRMGVEATIERAFEEGKAYRAAWKTYETEKASGKTVPPPRTDLRLEALASIVEGKIKIHSHCYRSDEILMLLRVAERHGVRVRSLQHVLEGYKVAAEIAAHGASASTFSDWWAYKVEAYDAIPFNAALLTKAGATVCIKSDSAELVRHLNLEAAKMVKYGGMTEDQALAMITINPAKELGLDHRLGSIEQGKDADIALFNGHPFDATSRCEMALIDGEVWFQRTPSPTSTKPSTMPSATAEARAKGLDVVANPQGSYAILGATIHPVSGAEIPNGTLVISKGKIAAVGGSETRVPDGSTTIDAKGLDIWPGMIDAGSPIGLVEISSLPETQDNADSAEFQPELRTSSALHPDSELIPVSRANGILAAYVQPSGGLIAGQGCLVQYDGWVPTEMTLVDRAALSVNIPTYVVNNPESPRRRFGAAGGSDVDPNERRKDRLDAIKEQFQRAIDYGKVVATAAERKAQPPIPDPRMEALLPYAKGEKLVIFRADQRVEILDAIKLAKELKLKAAITGAAEAWKVVEELKTAKIPVLVAGTLMIPNQPTDPYDSSYANPATLQAAGVPFAIRSIGRGPDQGTASRNLPYEAATAAAFGLSNDEALKAVTLYPAQILGVSDRLGSLEVGKIANVVVTAGHLLQPTTEVKLLMIGGKPVTPESRHTRLHATYARRLNDVKSGTAPLGLERSGTTAAVPAAGGNGNANSGGSVSR